MARCMPMLYSYYQRPNNMPSNKAQLQARVQRNKDIVVDIKLQNPCMFCGEDSPESLEFHHIDPSSKRCSVSRMESNAYAIKTMLIEMEKCVCICSNCHRMRHAHKLKISQDIVNLYRRINKAVNGRPFTARKISSPKFYINRNK